MANKEGINLIEESLGLLKELNHLDKECGGHGLGLLLVKDRKIVFFKKGVSYTTEACAKKMLKADYDYVLWHTRVKSVGEVKDSNCHPYVTKKKDFALMMNGTESQFGYIANGIGITDTELIFRNMAAFDVDPSYLTSLSSRFMGFKDGDVFVSNSTYSPLKFIKNKEGFVIASSFPLLIKCETLESGLWMQGDELKAKKEVTSWGKVSSYGSYVNHYSGDYKSYKDEELDYIRRYAQKDITEDTAEYSNWEEYQMSAL